MKRFIQISMLFVFVMTVISCKEKKTEIISETKTSENMYAKGFSIEESEDAFLLKVYNPWQNADGVEYEYKLSREGERGSINIPVEKVVCLSTTHIAYINELNRAKSVVGMSGTQFVFDENFREKVSSGDVVELGYSESVNAEKIVSMNPDVVFAFVVSPAELGSLQQIEEAGVPVVIVGEYLEKHPLGKMEWLRFFAAFYDEVDVANDRITERTESYKSLCGKVHDESEKPFIILNTPWQGVWWTPGADSYMATYISDAGGEYAFYDIKGCESQPVDMELVLSKIQKADVWLNPGVAGSKEAVFASDLRLKEFPELENFNIFNNNKRSHAFGNDFFESAVVNPDMVLEDLIRILHPGILPEGEMHYYQELN